MSYTPNVWQAGDVVTPVKLNHIEEGIANSVLVVHDASIAGVPTLDKTWQEIYDAIVSGTSVVVPYTVSSTKAYIGTVALVDYDENEGYSVIVQGESTHVYYASTTNGYPSQDGTIK